MHTRKCGGPTKTATQILLKPKQYNARSNEELALNSLKTPTDELGRRVKV